VWFRFITDVFTHWIVGRAVSTSLHTDALPPLALEAGSHGHRKLSGPGSDPSLGSRFQYVSLAYTDAIVVAEVTASVGTVGESYENALAEAVNGLYKTEPIFSRPAWETATTVEFATSGGGARGGGGAHTAGMRPSCCRTLADAEAAHIHRDVAPVASYPTEPNPGRFKLSVHPLWIREGSFID